MDEAFAGGVYPKPKQNPNPNVVMIAVVKHRKTYYIETKMATEQQQSVQRLVTILTLPSLTQKPVPSM